MYSHMPPPSSIQQASFGKEKKTAATCMIYRIIIEQAKKMRRRQIKDY